MGIMRPAAAGNLVARPSVNPRLRKNTPTDANDKPGESHQCGQVAAAQAQQHADGASQENQSPDHDAHGQDKADDREEPPRGLHSLKASEVPNVPSANPKFRA